MSRLLENSRYIALVGVLALMVAAVVAFVLGGIEAIRVVLTLFESGADVTEMTLMLIETVDIFLIATGLLFFSLGLYELFIDDLNLPEWMVIHDLYSLKAKLSSIIILVMAIKFLEKLFHTSDYQGLLYMGLGVAAVTAALIAFSYFGTKH